MVKYVNIGQRKLSKTSHSSGTISLNIPKSVLDQTKAEGGDMVDVLWDGKGDLLIRFPKKD